MENDRAYLIIGTTADRFPCTIVSIWVFIYLKKGLIEHVAQVFVYTWVTTFLLYYILAPTFRGPVLSYDDLETSPSKIDERWEQGTWELGFGEWGLEIK
jgi:hypothetical protein